MVDVTLGEISHNPRLVLKVLIEEIWEQKLPISPLFVYYGADPIHAIKYTHLFWVWIFLRLASNIQQKNPP